MIKRDIFNNVKARVVEASSRSYTSAMQQVRNTAASTLGASDAVLRRVDDAIEKINIDAALGQAREVVQSAGTEAHRLADQVAGLVHRVDANHRKVADGIESVSMGLGITAGVAAAGATLAAPTGIGAAAIALGLTSAPLIVTVAPVIAAAATTAGVVSGGAYFYSKWRSRHHGAEREPVEAETSDAMLKTTPQTPG